MAPIPRLKPYGGPALLSYGFRPFFLLGSILAGLEVLAWLPMFYGELSVTTLFSPRDWHVHELLFGYVPAIVTGFLLTAIPNWTGRLPLQGRPLLVLVLVWLAGRFAVTFSTGIGWIGVAVVDCAFLVLVAAAAAREIVAGKNWRNLRIVALVSLLAAGNLAFHVEAHVEGIALYASRLGIAVVIMLIMVVGGRIVPSFTRNWLVQHAPGRLPAPFGRFDVACLGLSAAGLVLWVVEPAGALAGAALIVAATLNVARLVRWAGDRTFADRLVLILHVGYAFVPLGFLLAGLAALGLGAPSAGIHAWTAGAIGIMTLAVMSRASLGHTGRPLAASPVLQAIYATVIIAAVVRISAALHPEWNDVLLHLAAVAWAAAFLGFAALYAPLLCRSKRPAVRAVG
ncbi:MAG: short-chain dehydrogenase [Alphaproteobacteria bacterium RIFCSPHIGHO2_12_FULL_66_14]|nr:MAG: short-chain dehydrogenase [Alphaproteobacteria bacterium RIFCSPHIGHO2_12_FULL_66_14]